MPKSSRIKSGAWRSRSKCSSNEGVLGVVREPQRVEQVGHGQEECRHAEPDALVGNGGRQVRLPGPIAPAEEKPTVQRAGEGLRLLESPFQGLLLLLAQANSPLGIERLKGQVPQFLKAAEAEEPLPDTGPQVALAANADLEATEVGMPEGRLHANVAQPVAMRAVRVAELIVGGRPTALARLRCRGCRRSAGEPSQCCPRSSRSSLPRESQPSKMART